MIVLDRIDRYRDGRPVLEDLSLHVEAKERLVVVGPSGCGKTTLLRIVAGLEAPDRGRVVIAGKVVSADGRILVEPKDRQIGMVFQDLALWPHMSVAGNLEFGLRVRGVARRERGVRVERMLREVGLEGYRNRRPSSLSGGERQRVALARALVLEPKIVLMDEPLSSLDEALNIRLRRLIVQLQERLGFTLLYVTHNKDEASQIATRLLRLGG